MVIGDRAGTSDERVVLCIEDDDSLAQLVALVLRRLPGVRVLTTGSRREALRAAARTQCAAVVTDLNLPDASGVTWVAELTTVPTLRGVPVVVMSADGTRRTIEAVTGAGAVCFLVKPVGRSELTSVIARLIGGPSDTGNRRPASRDDAAPRALIDRCISETTRDLQRMHEAIIRDDLGQFEWLCHRLRGRALMYGITGVIDVLDAIDRIDAAGRSDHRDIADQLVGRAEDALERYRLTVGP